MIEDYTMYNAGMDWGYWIAMFLLGGTNVWTVIMYILERKKRNIDLKGTKAEVDQKEFSTVRDQFEVFDKRLESYAQSLLEAENLNKKLRSEMQEMEKSKYALEIKIIKLEKLILQKSENECINFECRNRIRETKDKKNESYSA